MASLTKMMTALVCLQLCEELSINMKTTYFPVSPHNLIHGTSAFLVEDQCLSIHDLLRGLMLPSGNDASLVLAENLGARILFTKRPGEVLKTKLNGLDEEKGTDKEG
jgi:D-alanyl-D-alanine carboxypeptidase (penicillin-binding protein 5/6)